MLLKKLISKKVCIFTASVVGVSVSLILGGCQTKDPDQMSFTETYKAFVSPFTKVKLLDIANWKATESTASLIVSSANSIVDGKIVLEQTEKTTILDEEKPLRHALVTDGGIKLTASLNRVKTDFFEGKGEGLLKLAIRMVNGKIFFNPEKVDFTLTSKTPDDTLSTKVSSIKEMLKMYLGKWYVVDVEKWMPGWTGGESTMGIQPLVMRKNALKAFMTAQKIVTKSISEKPLLEQYGEKTEKGFPVMLSKTGVVALANQLLANEVVKSFLLESARQQGKSIVLPTEQEISQNVEQLLLTMKTLGLSFYLKPVDANHASLILDNFSKDGYTISMVITPGKGGERRVNDASVDVEISWEIDKETIPFSVTVTSKTGDVGVIHATGAIGISSEPNSFKGVLDVVLSLADFSFVKDVFDDNRLTINLTAGLGVSKKEHFTLQEPKDAVDVMTLLQGLLVEKTYGGISGYNLPMTTGTIPSVKQNFGNN